MHGGANVSGYPHPENEMAIVVDIDAAVAELALPPVVDTPAVVLLGLLAGAGRPVVLDAARVREIEPAAAPLLASLLRATRAVGYPASIVGAAPALRAANASLAPFFDPSPRGDDLLFLAPDLDETGFLPSAR
jgi:hypothetical protein